MHNLKYLRLQVKQVVARNYYAHNLPIFKYFLLFSVERVALRLKQENQPSVFRKLCEWE